MTRHARTTDPSTSHDAIPKNIPEQAWKILQAYRNGRELLDNDAYNLAGLGSSRAKSQRCSDLRHWGMIVRTGNKGRTPSGAAGYLCKITTAGLRYLKNGRDT